MIDSVDSLSLSLSLYTYICTYAQIHKYPSIYRYGYINISVFLSKVFFISSGDLLILSKNEYKILSKYFYFTYINLQNRVTNMIV